MKIPFGAIANTGSPGAIATASFWAPLDTTIALARGTGNPTFTRATTASVQDWEAIVRIALASEARFQGARREQNWWGVNTEDVQLWSAALATATAADTVNFTGSNPLSRVGTPVLSGMPNGTWVVRVEAKAGTKSTISARVGSVDGNVVNLTSDYRVYAWTLSGVSGASNAFITSGDTSNGTVNIRRAGLYWVSASSNQNPPEYISVGVLSGPIFHGSGVDGVKCFGYQNGNTVSSNVVTEAQGAVIPSTTLLGYLAEEARTNRCLWNRDKSNAAWVKTNVTVSSATGADGTSQNIRLTASAANGTILQSITDASAARIYSARVKRVTGTGNIDITIDGGATWTTISGSINSATFTTVSRAQTLANPQVGFRIATNGDAVDVDFDQEETGSFATMPIPTTSASVPRNADVLTYQTSGNFSSTEGTCAAIVWKSVDTTNVQAYLLCTDGSIGPLTSAASTSQIYLYDGANFAFSNGFTAGASYRLASSWGGSTTRTSLNGVLGTAAGFDGSMNAGLLLGVGCRPTINDQQPNSPIRNLRLWQSRLPDGTIAGL